MNDGTTVRPSLSNITKSDGIFTLVPTSKIRSA